MSTERMNRAILWSKPKPLAKHWLTNRPDFVAPSPPPNTSSLNEVECWFRNWPQIAHASGPDTSMRKRNTNLRVGLNTIDELRAHTQRYLMPG